MIVVLYKEEVVGFCKEEREREREREREMEMRRMMKTERELRAEGREKRAREYMQVDVRIQNEKIDFPAEGKKSIAVDAPGEELRMLRAERREKRAREEGQECQNKYKHCIKALPVENNKIDLQEPDLFDREKEKEKEDEPIRVLPVYAGEELNEFKANYPKVKGTLLPWKTKHRGGMDDRKQWPPIWKKKFKESPEYEAFHYFLLNRRSDARYKLICKEIRSSRGYDITHVDQYIPQEFHEMHLFAKCMAVAACKYVTDQINERAKDHGESYVFDEVKKVVRWKFPSAHYWYTFTVREERPTSGNIKTVQAFAYCQSIGKVLVFLKEWRFKP